MRVERGYQTFLAVTCLALAVLVVLLAWQNHQISSCFIPLRANDQLSLPGGDSGEDSFL